MYLSPTRYFKLKVFMIKNHINARNPWKHNPNLIRNKFHNPSINKIAYKSYQARLTILHIYHTIIHVSLAKSQMPLDTIYEWKHVNGRWNLPHGSTKSCNKSSQYIHLYPTGAISKCTHITVIFNICISLAVKNLHVNPYMIYQSMALLYI